MSVSDIIFDFLNAITVKKNIGIMEEDPELEKKYDPYKVNHNLSQHVDCLEMVNEMNGRPFTDKKMQFDFLINTIRKKYRRAEKWIKPDIFDDIENVKEYFNYSSVKARAALKILSSEDITIIKNKLRKGGIKK